MIESRGPIQTLRNEEYLLGGNVSECDDKKTNFDFEVQQGLNPSAVRSDISEQSVKSPKNNVQKLNVSTVSTPGQNNGDGSSSADDTSLRMLHVPYMDSKLTLLLRDSLGGNSRTVMITTLDPFYESYSQNLYSLNLASKASKVLNKPTANWTKMAEKPIESSPRRKEARTIV